MPLNGTLKSDTLYVSLNARSNQGEYHYGIVATDAKAKATLYHATNSAGDGRMVSKTGRPDASVTLIVPALCVKMASRLLWTVFQPMETPPNTLFRFGSIIGKDC
ncbi:hypothetical protein F4811DRAFT_134314 [Daldinia bambusicola]|nr:hypothetical protein F4811DRAFT_134314 [Daldinia bambusicola]